MKYGIFSSNFRQQNQSIDTNSTGNDELTQNEETRGASAKGRSKIFTRDSKLPVAIMDPKKINSGWWFQWISWRENLQETIDFPMKYGMFL